MTKIHDGARALRAGLTAPPPNLLDFLLLAFATLMLLRNDFAGLLFMVFVGVTRVGIILSQRPNNQTIHIHNLIASDGVREPSRHDLVYGPKGHNVGPGD